jgi:hypothetical protein
MGGRLEELRSSSFVELDGDGDLNEAMINSYVHMRENNGP